MEIPFEDVQGMLALLKTLPAHSFLQGTATNRVSLGLVPLRTGTPDLFVSSITDSDMIAVKPMDELAVAFVFEPSDVVKQRPTSAREPGRVLMAAYLEEFRWSETGNIRKNLVTIDHANPRLQQLGCPEKNPYNPVRLSSLS